MPALGTIYLNLNAIFIIHAARTGRLYPWAYVMLFLPGIGVLAYILLELLPAWRGTPRVRKRQSQLIKAIDPGRRYRALMDECEVADTVGNRLALADECLVLGKFDEAHHLYDGIIASPQGDEPVYYLGRANAEFGMEQPEKTLETLDALKRQWPTYRSQEGRLLYGKALEKLGRLDEALGEFASLSRYYAGPEPRIRQMRLLDRLGRQSEAHVIAVDVESGFKRAPAFARRQQAAWYAEAKSYARR